MAHGKCPGFSPEALARQALRVSAGGDFPVAREALEALLRRVAAGRRGEIRVVERPARGRVTGWYRVRRGQEPRREYAVYLASLEPLAGSCGCADYVKASLGLCKHILAVAAARGARARHAALRPERAPVLSWDPIRPLDGTGDWLDRLTWLEEGSASRGRSSTAAALFRAGRDGPGRLVRTFADDPRRRLELVESLFEMSRLRSGGRGSSPLAEPAVVTLLAREREELGRLVHHGVKRGRLVFVNSMSDLFHESVPTAFIKQVFDVMATQTQHRFQVLTKRPERVVAIASQLTFTPNIWVGVSVENADYAWRIDHLQSVPGMHTVPEHRASARPHRAPGPFIHRLGDRGWRERCRRPRHACRVGALDPRSVSRGGDAVLFQAMGRRPEVCSRTRAGWPYLG